MALEQNLNLTCRTAVRRKVNNTATQSNYFQTMECTQVSGVSIIAIGIVESKLMNTSPWSSVIRLVFVLRASALRIPQLFLQQFHALLQDVIFWYDTISIIISVIFLDGTVLNVWWMIYGWGRGKAPCASSPLVRTPRPILSSQKLSQKVDFQVV